MKGDIYEVLFRHSKTQQACGIVVDWLKQKDRQRATPGEVSQFARDLQAGKIVKRFTYRRASFYRVVRRRLLELGFVAKQSWFSREVVYTPVIQPIPKRAPVLTSWWGFAYLVAEKWNQEFEE